MIIGAAKCTLLKIYKGIKNFNTYSSSFDKTKKDIFSMSSKTALKGGSRHKD